MAIRPLVREISKTLPVEGPRSTGGFYSRHLKLTGKEIKVLHSLANMLPAGRWRNDIGGNSCSPSTERQG